MDSAALEPCMLNADWRDDSRDWLTVNLAAWPDGMAIDPLPPVPLIGIGPHEHPLARQMDVIADADIPLSMVTATISRCPLAAATLVQLLRATEGMAVEAAQTAESFAFAMLQAGTENPRWRAAQGPAAPDLPGEIRLAHDGATLDVLLDRSHARNAIDRDLRDALFDAFTVAAIDPAIERVRLRGAGRCFSVGADLAEFGTTADPVQAHAIRMRTLPARALVRRQAIYEAHIQGGCVGSGLELAAFAPRITASPDAWFQLPEVGMGILPGAGGCVSVPRRIGRQRAALLMLSGKRIGARTALRWGLIDAIMDDPPGDDRQADERA